MEINKKSRTELKAYFVKNALPTAGNFSDLIDAGLNQKDDGLVKSADQPVQIAASTAGDKPAIHLYESFATDTKPAWVLSLQAGGKKGLGIGDGDGKHRLFIEGATGGVGIGTADPAGYKLRVAGNVLVDGASGAATLVIKDGNVGIGTADPAGNKLRVAGNVLVDGTDGKARVSFGSGERQMLNLCGEGHGIGVQDATTYFRSSTSFAFYKGGTHSDGALDPGRGGTAMLVIKDGNVGIGTQDPSYKLQVNGSLSASSVDVSLGHAAACKEEVVRIVRGGVAADGSIFTGTGFTVKKVSTGLYDITFSTPFNSRASVVASQHYPGTNEQGSGDTRDNANVAVANSDRIRIKTGDGSGNAADRHFCFIAIGT